MRPSLHRPDAAVLLRTEHAVGRALAGARGEHDAYPALLAAIGKELGWDAGAVWLPAAGDGLERTATWPTDAAEARKLGPGEGLPGRVWADGRPAWCGGADAGPRMRAAFAFPVRGPAGPLAVMELAAADDREYDADLLDTMASLGSQIGQFVERERAQRAVRDSDARKSAILNAAFDCIITVDAGGRVVELNPATETTFGYAAADMVGRELIELVVPPADRERQRAAFARYRDGGEPRVRGGRVAAVAQRADGTEFPIDIAIRRPDAPGPPLFCVYVRDLTERRAAEEALRRLADEQAALRRVATAVATETDPRAVFGIVTEEVGRLLDAQSSNMVRYNDDGTMAVVGGWSAGGRRSVPVGSTVPMDGDTAAVRVYRSGRPARVDSYRDLTGRLAAQLRELGFKTAVAAPVVFGGGLWGAVIVSSVDPDPFPPGDEQRLADFAELAAQALANAHAHQELAASRARIVEAADAERRRLERNLHDGAQQRLVSLSLLLGLVARCVDADPAARAMLDRVREDLGEALEELRELARGIHPAVLTDRGLEPAVASLTARSPVPVTLTVELGERLPEPVEAAAYYVVAEALTNAARHARASCARVHVRDLGGLARVEVADDGVGGATVDGGSGLRGLADRVEALGGRLRVESAAGAGTTVLAEIPVR